MSTLVTIINNSLMLIGTSDRSHCLIYEPKTIFKWGAFRVYEISILLLQMRTQNIVIPLRDSVAVIVENVVHDFVCNHA